MMTTTAAYTPVCGAQPFRYTKIQCWAPLNPIVGLSWEDRLEGLELLLDSIRPGVAADDTLKLFLAPVLFLDEEDDSSSSEQFCRRYLQTRARFSHPRFRHWLIVPGTLHYEDDGEHYHRCPIFLGGTDIATSVLQQTFPHGCIGPQRKNAVYLRPHDHQVLRAHPILRMDDFRPETGLRLALEIGADHRDGLLWSAIAEDTSHLPDLQLVPDMENNLVDNQQRILGNTCALRPGGLLFSAGLGRGSLHGNHPPCRLYVHQGLGMYAPIKPEQMLTAMGAVARFPTQPI